MKAPSGTLIKRTNKAELFRLPDGSIVKHYITPDGSARVQYDQRSLLTLQSAFGIQQHQGWIYRVVKPLWFSVERALVCMDLVPGRTISELPKAHWRESEYQAGVWLALYHNRLLDDEFLGPLYTDFTVHNVLVDTEQKSVTAIDPGMNWSRHGSGYEDIIKHLHSIIVGLIMRQRASLLTLHCFLKGYAHTTRHRPRCWAYYRSLLREACRQQRDYAKYSKLRWVFFPLVMLSLSPLYLAYVPVCLYWGQASRERTNRRHTPAAATTGQS
jgi:hypothetical protein